MQKHHLIKLVYLEIAQDKWGTYVPVDDAADAIRALNAELVDFNMEFSVSSIVCTDEQLQELLEKYPMLHEVGA